MHIFRRFRRGFDRIHPARDCAWSHQGLRRLDNLHARAERQCRTGRIDHSRQAVYAYSGDDYVWWSQQLDRDIEHGTFGENLTIQGLPEDLNVGDRLLIGDVVLEVTAPRIPCDTLSAQMQDSRFGMAFRRAERPGVYLRVLHEGCVAAGDSVALLEIPQADASINELFRLAYDLQPKAADLRRYLAAPIAERVRKNIDQRLLALEG
ncbi:MAG: MOSC domain-containing protein [Proteobacteria bacterium]|nr:MOSC domain-containing protein [Pseudomonadota bacterium]